MQKPQGIVNPLGLDLVDATGFTTDQGHFDPDLVEGFAWSMRVYGWQGAPLVVLPEYTRAYTGTHRLAAAKASELTEIPAVDLADVFAAHGLDMYALAAEEGLSILEDRAALLAHLPADTLAAYGLEDIL
ncbi:ParB/RepB/Spo0J family partition protein [Streptomyces sp. NPDC048281]|uniref:ParB/RepB/Spo0J family partition protein n=1 Tax=Streptomyces sp. NPDC048281 TaxID=3154715 RepID=UPI003442436A